MTAELTIIPDLTTISELPTETLILDEKANITIFQFRVPHNCDLCRFYVSKSLSGLIKAEMLIGNKLFSVAIKGPHGEIDFLGAGKLFHLFLSLYNEISIRIYISNNFIVDNFVLRMEKYFVDSMEHHQHINIGLKQKIIRAFEIIGENKRPKSIEFIPCILTYQGGILSWKDDEK
jgi:hypothetical protein